MTEDLETQIQEMKKQIEQQKLLNELTKLKTELGPHQAATQNDPMQKMLKFAFPVGIIFAGLGFALNFIFGQFLIGLMFVGLGAMAIAVKIGLTPSIKIPIFDKPKPPPISA